MGFTGGLFPGLNNPFDFFKDPFKDFPNIIPRTDIPDFAKAFSDIPDAPSTPEDTLRNLGAPEGLNARQFAQRSSVARQLGLPTSGLNIPLL